MQLKDLRILFDSGVLTKATITNNILGQGYIVTVSAKDKKQYNLCGQRTQGEPRVFKSIDAAVRNISDIGFREVTVTIK